MFRVVIYSLTTLAILNAQVRAQDVTPGFRVQDVALTADGQFQGQVLNASGAPLDGTTVLVKQGARELTKTTTDRAGRFQMAGLKNGAYSLEAAGQTQAIRLWNAQIAPPSAKQGATVIAGAPEARGQMGLFDPATLTNTLLGVAGVTLAAITYSEVDGLNGDLDSANAKIDELTQKLDDLTNQLSN